MACGDDLEGRVRRAGLGDSISSALGNLIPGVAEASVDAAVANVGAAGLAKVDVCEPVADVAAAADREDNLLADVVSGDVASDTSAFSAITCQLRAS